MLTAGVMDSDAYLDAAGVNSIFLSPETDGWSHNCLLGLFFQNIVVFISHHSLIHLPLIGQRIPKAIYQSWAGCGDCTISLSSLPSSPTPCPVKLLLVVAKILLKVTEFQTTQQSQLPGEHEMQAGEAFSVITPWSC